jgi:hypothetical protein
MRRVIAIVGSPSLIDADILEALEELVGEDRVAMGHADEWRAHSSVHRLVAAYLSVREESPIGPLAARDLLWGGATDLWAIWDGHWSGVSAEEEWCPWTICQASKAGLRIRVVVVPVGRRCARSKTVEQKAEV